MARITKKYKKLQVKKSNHGSVKTVEVNYEHKYILIVCTDGYVITIIDEDFDIVVEAFDKKT